MNIRHLLYRIVSAILPLDNILEYIYSSKPGSAGKEEQETWIQLEQTALNYRTLLLDSLSFGNEIRREQALQFIVPTLRMVRSVWRKVA
jgi:hypothetical protein